MFNPITLRAMNIRRDTSFQRQWWKISITKGSDHFNCHLHCSKVVTRSHLNPRVVGTIWLSILKLLGIPVFSVDTEKPVLAVRRFLPKNFANSKTFRR